MNVTDAEQAFFGQTVEQRLDDLSALPRPVYLRAVPREEWDQWLNHELTVPPEVERYLEGQFAFNAKEIAAIEAAVERWHGIVAPWGIYLSASVAGGPVAMLVRTLGR